MVIFRNGIKKGVDAWRQVLAVCADSEEVDLVAPELAQALDDRTRSEFGLQIPSRFQGDTLIRAHPVMHHFTTRRAQDSVDDHFEVLSLVLKEPCIY
jgi:hypothetical protein